MALFLDILLTITGPIVILIGAGWWLQPKLDLDIGSLNRLIVHVVLPAFFVHYLSTSSVPVSAAWNTAWFTIVQFASLTVLGWAIASLLGLHGAVAVIIGLSMGLSNSGNFGLPLIELAFGADMILHQAVIVSIQTIFVFTIGPMLLLGGTGGWRSGLRRLASPIYGAILLGLALNALDLTLPPLLARPMEMLGGLYTPIALFTLGAQLATANGRILDNAVTLSVGLKLVAAPIITGLALSVLGFGESLSHLLIATAAAPVGVTLVIMATQVERETDVAAAAVFVSTLLSPLTVTLCLFLLR